MNNFDPYNVFLAIATNKPVRLKTGFELQGHKFFVTAAFFLFVSLRIKLRIFIIPMHFL